MAEKKLTTSITIHEVSERPDSWLKGMHAYRRETGHFRTEDVRKVLGNQRSGVQVKAASVPGTSSYVKAGNRG